MVEIAETTEQPRKSSFWSDFWSAFWFPVIFGFGSSILRKGFGVYAPVAWIIWGAITICICYRIMPPPKPNFIKYFVVVESSLIVMVGALWYAPQLLGSYVPDFWAYTLPAVLVFAGAYFVIPLLGNNKRGKFLWWLIGSVVVAALLGYFISSAPEGKN